MTHALWCDDADANAWFIPRAMPLPVRCPSSPVPIVANGKSELCSLEFGMFFQVGRTSDVCSSKPPATSSHILAYRMAGKNLKPPRLKGRDARAASDKARGSSAVWPANKIRLKKGGPATRLCERGKWSHDEHQFHPRVPVHLPDKVRIVAK